MRLGVQGNLGGLQDFQSGLFPDLTLEAVQDGFMEFHGASGYAPGTVITASDEQEALLFIPNDGASSRADQGPRTHQFP